MTTPITAGDTEPSLVFTLSDKRSEVDFSTVTVDKVKVKMWLGEVVLRDVGVTSVVVAPGGKSLVVTRDWGANETITPGNWRIVPRIEWSPTKTQTFPTMILVVNEQYDGDEN